MNPETVDANIDMQHIEALIQAIRSLPPRAQAILEQKLFDHPEPSTLELMHLAESGGAFDFLHDEPDIYTLEDGEPIQWS